MELLIFMAGSIVLAETIGMWSVQRRSICESVCLHLPRLLLSSPLAFLVLLPKLKVRQPRIPASSKVRLTIRIAAS